MNKVNKKYNYIYIVVCTNKNSRWYGHYYIGKHSTNNLDDNYIASGTKIRKYLKKYPNDYYRKILEYSNTEEELNNLEYNYIHGLLNTSKCLNLVEGGGGHSKPQSEETKRKISKTKKDKPQSEEHRKHNSEAHKDKPRTKEIRNRISESMKGKNQSEETRRKRSESMKRYWQNKKLNIITNK